MTQAQDPQPTTTITSLWVAGATVASICRCTTWTPTTMPAAQLAPQPHTITTHPHTAATSTFAAPTPSSLSSWAFPIQPLRSGPSHWSPQMMAWQGWPLSSSSCLGVSWLQIVPVWALHWLLCVRTCKNTVAMAMEGVTQGLEQGARGC